jgi:3-oxoacyl-[acyl-carrier-protein] synthase-3
MRNSKIVGVGKYLPQKTVTNHDLEKMMETSDQWIRERSGIGERRYSDGKQETTSWMGAQAAKNALKMAGLTENDVDFIVFATLSPDYFFPGSGCPMQVHLGVKNIGAMDIRNQCTGFVYGIAAADQFIKSSMYNTILVVGAEVQSAGLNRTTEGRDVAVLFGDGAGAAVLTATEEKGKGILSNHLHADGNFVEELWAENPGSATHPISSIEDIEKGTVYPFMNGKNVFKHAVTKFPAVILEALEKNNYQAEDIDLVVPHQANARITEAVQTRLQLPKEKIYSNIHKYGNTTAASIPIALTEAVEENKIKNNSLVCLAAFGSGFTWASSLIRW